MDSNNNIVDVKKTLIKYADDLTAYISSLEFDIKMYVILATPGSFEVEITECSNCKHFKITSDSEEFGSCSVDNTFVYPDECCEFYKEVNGEK